MINLTTTLAAALAFIQFRVSGDTAEFIGPTSSDVNTESLFVKSIAPKRGNNQYGNRRSSINLVRATDVLDLEGASVVRNRKLTIEGSLPVGTLEADIVEDAYQLGLLLQDATFVKSVFLTGVIEH